MEPIAITVAGAEPDRAAKNMEASTVTWPSPPLKPRTRLLAKLMSLSERPPNFMRLPASIKKGIAISGKESRPRKQYWGIVMTLRSVVRTMVTSVETPREIPTGTLAIISTIRSTNNKITPDITYSASFASLLSRTTCQAFCSSRKVISAHPTGTEA